MFTKISRRLSKSTDCAGLFLVGILITIVSYLLLVNQIVSSSILISKAYLIVITIAIAAYLYQRHRSSQALKEGEARFRLLISSVKDYAIFALDNSGKVVSWNAGAEANKGYAEQEIIGQDFAVFYPPERIATGYPSQCLERARKAGRHEEEGWRVRKDGSRFWANVVITPMYNPAGALCGYSKVTRDITERKHHDDILKAKNEELALARIEADRARAEAEAASKAKGEFVANVSHEVRTPLTSIIGFTEDCLNSSLSPEEQRTHLQIVLRNSRHLLNIINGILDVSKLEANKLVVTPSRVGLVELIEEIVEVYAAKARKHNLVLNVRYEFPLPDNVLTDATRVREIVHNLLDNAIKFTHEGSIELRIACRKEASQAQITVTDTGIGIPAEQQLKIFSPFNQGDGSIAGRFGGTGLGLYISKKIASRLGGSLTFKSTPKVGSSFLFTFSTGDLSSIPFNDGLPSKKSNQDTGHPQTVSYSGRVLLVDDTEDTQHLFSVLLRRRGVFVEVASTGQQALERTKRDTYDLLFMDLQMPNLDGIAVTKALRERGYRAPIIACTANLNDARRAESLNAGCTGCLGKPFSAKELDQTLAAYLSLSTIKSSNPQTFEFERDRREFMQSFDHLLLQFEQTLDRRDFIALSKLAHRTAGAAAFGYREMYDSLARLEIAAESGSQLSCDRLITEIKARHSCRGAAVCSSESPL